MRMTRRPLAKLPGGGLRFRVARPQRRQARANDAAAQPRFSSCNRPIQLNNVLGLAGASALLERAQNKPRGSLIYAAICR